MSKVQLRMAVDQRQEASEVLEHETTTDAFLRRRNLAVRVRFGVQISN